MIVHFLVSGLQTVQTGHGVGVGFTFEEFESPCFARPLDTGMVRGSPGVNPPLTNKSGTYQHHPLLFPCTAFVLETDYFIVNQKLNNAQ